MKLASISAFCLLFFSFFAANVHAHGEDKPGPNSGVIRMPGTYHTELVAHGDHLMVYLLDIRFKNPVTQDSSVKLKVGDQVKECEAKKDFFECWATGLDLKKHKKLELQTVRAGVVGKVAEYSWPLEFSKKAASGHEHH